MKPAAALLPISLLLPITHDVSAAAVVQQVVVADLQGATLDLPEHVQGKAGLLLIG